MLPEKTKLSPTGKGRAKSVFNSKARSIDIITNSRRFKITPQKGIFSKYRCPLIKTVCIPGPCHMPRQIRGLLEITESETIFKNDPISDIEPVGEPRIDKVLLAIWR